MRLPGAQHLGGIENYTESLANELGSSGNTVIVVTSRLSNSDPAREKMPNGVEVFRLPCHSLMDGRLPIPAHNSEHGKMLRKVADFKPDRILVNARFYPHSLDGVRFASQLHVPAFLIEHGSAYITLNNPFADVLIRKWENVCTKQLQRYPLHFAAVSKKSADWLRHFGVTAEAVFPNAIKTSDTRGDVNSASNNSLNCLLSMKNCGNYKLIATFVGRYIPEKGISSILESSKRLADEPILFVFAGSGPLEELINSQSNQSAILNLGQLAHKDVASLLEISDVLCLPSRSEGFSTTLLEAAAAGCMPITTDVGGAREIGLIPTGYSNEGVSITEHGILLKDAGSTALQAGLLWALKNRDARLVKAASLKKRVLTINTWQKTARAIDAAFSNVEKANDSLPEFGRRN